MAGKITTNSVVLGDSVTDTQNFVLKTNVDGTATLARGALGTLGTVLSVDANSNVVFTGGMTGSFTGTLSSTHNSFQSIIALTDAATIVVDMSVTGGNNFSVTLGGNRTLGNPTGLTAGQSGVIYITQDGTGSRTLAYSSFWDFQNSAAPTLSTAIGAVDVLVYSVRSSTSIVAQLITNIG